MLDQNRLERFKSKPYRDSYVSNRVRTAIATQLRTLREQFSPTQTEFAKTLGKPQSVVSRLENPNYGNMSVNTLLEIAQALDITLVVKFMSYDAFFDHLNDEHIASSALRVEPFSETLQRHERLSPAPVISEGLRQQIIGEKPQPPEQVIHLATFRDRRREPSNIVADASANRGGAQNEGFAA